MKKLIGAALFCFLGLTHVNAQVAFNPGIKAGANFSHFTQTSDPNERYYTKTDFYVGFYGALKLSKVYTMQPELLYTRQGSGREYIDQNNVIHDSKITIAYLSFALANKFTFSKFNIHMGPTFDIRINDVNKELGDQYNDPDYNYYGDYSNGIDLAFFIGAGFDITKNLGIEARIKKGIVPVNDAWDSENVVFQTGLTYTFDVK